MIKKTVEMVSVTENNDGVSIMMNPSNEKKTTHHVFEPWKQQER